MMFTLLLGGARSGKSRHAEALARAYQNDVIYIATATAGDDEMKARIKQHREERPSQWETIEESLFLADVFSRIKESVFCQSKEATKDTWPTLIIDCMTLWLSNWLCNNAFEQWQEESRKFLAAVKSYPGNVIIVSNEVGSGIVPMGELSRVFVDQAGWLNQKLAEQADDVMLVVAGCSLPLKKANP